ncbi:MAG: thioredoxin family protein [Deltaproteobacteria bacterium]|nr:MAG: thioredoxin family protein [Deltaproteobacteria bacterium]
MSVKQINIGGSPVGLSDLDEIFKQIRDTEIRDKEELKNFLLKEVKSKNYVPSQMEDTYREALFEEYQVFTGELKARSTEGAVPEIRVYGAGCPRCEKLDRMTMDIIANKDITADYRYVTDAREIADQGILATPTMTVNDQVVLTGNVPGPQQLEKLITQALDKTSSRK